MTLGSILTLCAIGLVAGWLAGTLSKGKGFGLVTNLFLGIGGAFLGRFLFGALGFNITTLVGQIIAATVGALVIVFLFGMARK